MSGPDLDAELHTAVCRLQPAHVAHLRRLGVTPLALAAVAARNEVCVGLSRAAFTADGFWHPTEAPDGFEAIVQPVFDNDALIDLVAWRLSNPRDWRLRTVTAWAMGDVLWPSLFDGFDRCELHATPLGWLRAGGAGSVILDWESIESIRSLAMFDMIVTTDSALQTRLHTLLSRPARVPKIVMHGEMRLAA